MIRQMLKGLGVLGIIFALCLGWLGAGWIVEDVAYAQVTGEVDLEFENGGDRLDDIQRRLDDVGAELDLLDVKSEEKRGRVVEILEKKETETGTQLVLDIEVEGEVYRIDTGDSYLEGLRYKVREGDRVFVQLVSQGGEVQQVFLVDVVRYNALIWIGLIFSIVIIAVGRRRGFMAVLGLIATLAIIFGVVVPLIIRGVSPLWVAFFATLAILGINMPLAHGLSKSTLYAYLSTVAGASFVAFFAVAFTELADLSGLASEEAILLYYQDIELIVPRGILLAGILIGAIGVLDDIAITQTEVVAELKRANPKLGRSALYKRAMRVGRHHIASTVNTLVLAYAGVALPLLVLFLISKEVSLLRFLNEEPLVEEIVRTVAGTLGLVLTVPISTWFATLLSPEDAKEVHTHHSHGGSSQ